MNSLFGRDPYSKYDNIDINTTLANAKEALIYNEKTVTEVTVAFIYQESGKYNTGKNPTKDAATMFVNALINTMDEAVNTAMGDTNWDDVKDEEGKVIRDVHGKTSRMLKTKLAAKNVPRNMISKAYFNIANETQLNFYIANKESYKAYMNRNFDKVKSLVKDLSVIDPNTGKKIKSETLAGNLRALVQARPLIAFMFDEMKPKEGDAKNPKKTQKERYAEYIKLSDNLRPHTRNDFVWGQIKTTAQQKEVDRVLNRINIFASNSDNEVFPSDVASGIMKKHSALRKYMYGAESFNRVSLKVVMDCNENGCEINKEMSSLSEGIGLIKTVMERDEFIKYDINKQNVIVTLLGVLSLSFGVLYAFSMLSSVASVTGGSITSLLSNLDKVRRMLPASLFKYADGFISGGLNMIKTGLSVVA
jgi:hypothetical protein